MFDKHQFHILRNVFKGKTYWILNWVNALTTVLLRKKIMHLWNSVTDRIKHKFVERILTKEIFTKWGKIIKYIVSCFDRCSSLFIFCWLLKSTECIVTNVFLFFYQQFLIYRWYISLKPVSDKYITWEARKFVKVQMCWK